MATHVKTFTFNGGSTEGFADGGNSSTIIFQGVSDDGTPSADGCVQFDCSGSMVAELEYAKLLNFTWEDLGVPAGATITAVQVTDYDDKLVENNKITSISILWYMYAQGTSTNIFDSGSLLVENLSTPVNGYDWSTGSPITNNNCAVNSSYQDSDTALDLVIAFQESASGGNNSQYSYDNIQLTITYTPASTTAAPTTLEPTTLAPTTIPTTLAPTTIPTTLAPTTLAPTTLPTTLAPTTLAPTTAPPEWIVQDVEINDATTVAPTTIPTTAAPTTLAPTTLPPTTLAPTTLAPTYSGRGVGRGIIRGVYR